MESVPGAVATGSLSRFVTDHYPVATAPGTDLTAILVMFNQSNGAALR